jgi:hypothetical protein
MNKTLKTELTREEVQKLLDLYNTIEDAMDDVMECLDINISTLRDIREKTSHLRMMFDFRPAVDEGGTVKHYLGRVLPDDENAWFYKDTD